MMGSMSKTGVAGLALAAVLALSPAARAESYTLGSASVGAGSLVNYGSLISLTAGQVYNFALSWAGVSNTFGLFGARLVDSSNVVVENITALFPASTGSGSTSTSFVAQASYTGLTFQLAGYSSTATGVSSTLSAVSPLPAPGPIAGAGLPLLLGLAGLGVWRRRKAA